MLGSKGNAEAVVSAAWPLNRGGPLPSALDDPAWITDAFFQFHPAHRNLPTSVVRRALKQAAKRLGSPYDRGSSPSDLRRRDEALAHMFACTSEGREEIGRIEIHLEAGRGGRRSRQRALRLADGLPEVLWSRFAADPTKKDLVRWVMDASVSRPDLGPAEAFYLTGASVREASGRTPPPIAPDDPDLARVLLIFAGLLPSKEARLLLQEGFALGVPNLIPEPERDAETPAAQVEPERITKVAAEPIAAEREPAFLVPSSTRRWPALPPVPSPDSIERPSPPRSAEATSVLADLEAAADYAGRTEADVRSRQISADLLLESDKEKYAELLAAVDGARASAAALSSVVSRSEAFAREEVRLATNMLSLPVPSWLEGIRLSIADAAAAVIAADTVAALSRLVMTDTGTAGQLAIEGWLPARDLDDLRSSLEALAAEQAFNRAIAERASTFVSEVRMFLADDTFPSAARVDWLRQLTADELALLLPSVDAGSWPVAAGVLARLACDAGPASRDALQHALSAGDDQSKRRDLLHLVDPSASGLDDHPVARRFIAAEVLRDVLAFGPLVLVTDPTYRLTDEALVGGPVTGLIGTVVRNLDLLDAPGELSRLVAGPAEQPESARDAAAAALLDYATTPSTSAGFYLQLREAVRERHFVPLVALGRIDAAAACALARDYDVEVAIETAVEDVRHENPRAIRIEARHRARIHRYVATGQDLLVAFARSATPNEDSRRGDVSRELKLALSQLARSPAKAGSIEWLEGEVATMIEEPDRPEAPTLRGTPPPLLERDWTPSDTAWAQHSTDLPEFYLTGQPAFAVVAGALREWARGRRLSAEEILEDLIARGRFAAAVSFAEEAYGAGVDRSALRTRARQVATEAAAPLRERLDALDERFGSELIASLPSATDLRRLLDAFELPEASEQLELLEMEATEATELRRRDALDETQAAERTALLRQLLKAGVAGPDERWALADLKKRWEVELRTRLPERAHLRTIERALDVPETPPELAGELEAFAHRALDPENWLVATRAKELESFVEAPAEKLRTWLRISRQLDLPQRQALVEVVRWFIGFVEEQAAGLGALESGQPSDPLLEPVLEASEIIEQASAPASCAAELGLNTTDVPTASPEPEAGRSLTVDEAPAMLVPLIERSAWRELADAARTLRLVGDDENAKRMAETAEFGDVLAALEAKEPSPAGEELVTAARVLGAGGHLIGRTLPSQRLLGIAFGLVAAALSLGATRSADPSLHPAPDGSWSALLRHGLHAALTGPGTASRVIEQLCTGALGREVVNRIWDAPTARSEPGPLRASLLAFLYEHGLSEHLLFLAGRHEPAIRARLGQLLDLRAVAEQRPDLVPVSEAVASQVAKAAQGVPFRNFIAGLPSAVRDVGSELVVTVDNDIVLRIGQLRPTLAVAVSIEPRGLVPEFLEAVLFPEDDVTFNDGSRRKRLSDQPVYFASQWSVDVRFGASWTEAGRRGDETFRVRVNAKVLTGELVSKDVVCQLTRADQRLGPSRRIDDETLLDAFPGVENTPALGETFIGRNDELERLHGNLVQARRPSPVLLTGMRRIGKTSLLYAFHERHRQPRRAAPLTVYFSLAERRAALMDRGRQVGSVFYSAIEQALGKRHFSSTDHNRELGERLRQRLGTEKDAVRDAIASLHDPESLSDSLLVLSERLLEWVGGASRVIYLIDEAETLVLPFRGPEAKKNELEQFMQALREVSQTSSSVGLLLSGSNHIAEFAKSYKNAFFGSSLRIDLGGMTEPTTASRLVSPSKLTPYLDFRGDAVAYAVDMCAGMPQFLWQLGATVAAMVRSGPVTTADVRHAVAALVGERSADLPFNAYDVLEPIEHMLGLSGPREQDLLWLLLWRVANSSSLVVQEANQSFIIDQSLLELDELEGWRNRLLFLVSLEILDMPRPSTYRFRVPIFAEGFRAQRQRHAYQMRHQRAAT